MTTVGERLENYSVTGADLERLGVPFTTYSQLRRGRPLTTQAVLYEVTAGKGHWALVSVDEDNTRLEFFDPYGLSPDEEEKAGATLSASQGRVLSEMIDQWQTSTGGEVVINARQLQDIGPKDNTCGRWVVARYFCRHVPLEEWLAQYPGPPRKNDLVIVHQTFPIIGN